MKTTRSRKAISGVQIAIMVIIIVIIAIFAAAYVYYDMPVTSTSHSKESTTATGPSVMGPSGSRDINPHSPPEFQPR